MSDFSQLHHLAHVGYLLSSAFQNPPSTWTYLQVRNILLVLADFLEKIESTRVSTPGLAGKLRAQIARIDRLMQQTSEQSQDSGMISMGRSLISMWPDTYSTGPINHSEVCPESLSTLTSHSSSLYVVCLCRTWFLKLL